VTKGFVTPNQARPFIVEVSPFLQYDTLKALTNASWLVFSAFKVINVKNLSAETIDVHVTHFFCLIPRHSSKNMSIGLLPHLLHFSKLFFSNALGCEPERIMRMALKPSEIGMPLIRLL
jgi:hypothetical protein